MCIYLLKKMYNKAMKIKIGPREKEIIKSIGLGILVIASLAIPNLPLALKPFFKTRGREKFRRILKRLEEKDVIFLGGEKIKLTKKGKDLLKEIQFREITIPKPQKWDGVWHLISYDIPDDFKQERDWFRFILKRLGFRKIQESLWVHPFECKEEIAIIAQNLSVSAFVIIMKTNHLPNQSKFKKYFKLR